VSVGLAGYKTGQGKPMRVLAASVKDEDQRRESHETRLSSISIFCLELFTHTVYSEYFYKFPTPANHMGFPQQSNCHESPDTYNYIKSIDGATASHRTVTSHAAWCAVPGPEGRPRWICAMRSVPYPRPPSRVPRPASHVPPQPLPHARVALAHPLGRCGGEPLGPGLLRERVPHVGVLDRLELGASCGRACGGRSVRHK
jgi:hypothetical protein